MWKVTRGQTLQHRTWDDESVVYNSLSGDTHLLDGGAMDVLLLLQQSGAMDEQQVFEALGAEPGDADELAFALDQLHSLALVERV